MKKIVLITTEDHTYYMSAKSEFEIHPFFLDRRPIVYAGIWYCLWKVLPFMASAAASCSMPSKCLIRQWDVLFITMIGSRSMLLRNYFTVLYTIVSSAKVSPSPPLSPKSIKLYCEW